MNRVAMPALLMALSVLSLLVGAKDMAWQWPLAMPAAD